MNGWIIAAIVLCLLIIWIWFTSIRIEIQYKRENENDHLEIKFSIWKFIRYKITISMLQIQNLVKGIPFTRHAETEEGNDVTDKKRGKFTRQDVHRIKDTVTELMHNVHDFRLIAKRVMRTLRCEKLEWTTTVGLGEAPATGVFTGMVWGIKSVIVGFFTRYITLRTVPHLQVIPEFNREQFDVKFACTLRVKIGAAIITGFPIVMSYLRGGSEASMAKIHSKV
ncbi:DUF2953 domain-containing protein [Aneurinibacillus sp. Ricciae_BoGa-3]|uniref:DUF2953 domain-containing protein n=1 Tax=Aneurinibacillus sp. Ricciae_BoGa-3 TaxID=3022697 RepID=UPI002340E6EA|nr:DUF2953 domain-containing protein [Aneurinibacillus sp. Ricciae_BoGa-3]WCK55834.1 DUF2953 domain-containing protein [Aneurinibacillus sp. Ricciae_BoGa-3]